jgi:hypothetical protein
MTAARRMQTRPASAADARAYLDKAREFLRAAEDSRELGNRVAAAGNAVHAGNIEGASWPEVAPECGDGWLDKLEVRRPHKADERPNPRIQWGCDCRLCGPHGPAGVF